MFFGYENKEEYSLYVPKNTFKRNVDLLLTEEEDKKQYVFIEDIHTFRYDHRLPRGRKNLSLLFTGSYYSRNIKSHDMITFKLMLNKWLRSLKL